MIKSVSLIQQPIDKGYFMELSADVMAMFGSLPVNLQVIILFVLFVVTVAAHIAPYTPTKKDDFLFLKKNALLSALSKVFTFVSGNYRNAKNHGDAMAEKKSIKAMKNK